MILSGIILVASRFFYVSHEMRGCMRDLRELLHILIPPIIGIAGAVLGFYFGERNMG